MSEAMFDSGKRESLEGLLGQGKVYSSLSELSSPCSVSSGTVNVFLWTEGDSKSEVSSS